MMFQRHLLSHIWLVWVSIISVGSSINNQFIQHFKLLFREIHEFEVQKWSSWWLNQPIWKICSSNRIISLRIGMNIKMFELPPPSYPIILSEWPPFWSSWTLKNVRIFASLSASNCESFIYGRHPMMRINFLSKKSTLRIGKTTCQFWKIRYVI